MIIECGDMWSVYSTTDLFLFTANGRVTLQGQLVMGRGMARQVRTRFPGIARRLGTHIGRPGLHTYSLLVSPQWPIKKTGAFQVKFDWSEEANLTIIHDSVEALSRWCMVYPDMRVDMNYPGIGNGRRLEDDIQPIICVLPDSVHVWKYKDKRRLA